MMGLLKKKQVAAVLMATLAFPCLHADDRPESSFYFGIGGGYHSSHMVVSDLDKDLFPENSNQGSGLFDFFLQYEFGRKKQFGIRLELDFLKRGGTLDNIANTSGFPGFYEEEGITNSSYKLRSSYFDIRLPLIYQFCGARSLIRPYVYVAPIVAVSTGGKIKARTDFVDGSFAGTELDISKANMSTVYFGGAVGIGLKYDLNLYGHPFYLSVEANYQMGFSNTYSSKEKEGSAVVKDNHYFYAYDITGSRRFNGFEIKGSVSIPFSVFSKKKATKVVEYVPEWVQPKEEPAEPIEEVEEVPCRSIDEITAMISRGEDIRGVTFCSIDDIRFETNSSEIEPSSYKYLNEVASILKNTGVSIEVKGHTDNTGTEQLNLNLSRQRAMSVVKYLESKGVDKQQLSYSFYGATRPIADNDTEKGRSINRRVEFEIK